MFLGEILPNEDNDEFSYDNSIFVNGNENEKVHHVSLADHFFFLKREPNAIMKTVFAIQDQSSNPNDELNDQKNLKRVKPSDFGYEIFVNKQGDYYAGKFEKNHNNDTASSILNDESSEQVYVFHKLEKQNSVNSVEEGNGDFGNRSEMVLVLKLEGGGNVWGDDNIEL